MRGRNVFTLSQNGLRSSFASGCFVKSDLLAFVPTGPISVAFRVRLCLVSGKKYFTLRTSSHGNNFPRDVVEERPHHWRFSRLPFP